MSDKRDSRQFSATLTGQKLPQSLSSANSPSTLLLRTNSAMHLENGDFCELQQFVIVKARDQSTFIARVAEILQIEGTADALSQRPSGILLQSAIIDNTADESYGMPAVHLKEQWSLVKMAVREFF